MIASILSNFSNLLSDYLKVAFRLNEDIVSINPLISSSQSLPDNKIHISVVNIERETAGGIQFSRKSISNSHSSQGAPSWQLNLYIIVAAVFSEKQYEESIRILSSTLVFIQNNNSFTVSQIESRLSIEPVNLSFNELSNLWSINGGNYYPSVLCKIRILNIDSNEIKQIHRSIEEKNVNL